MTITRLVLAVFFGLLMVQPSIGVAAPQAQMLSIQVRRTALRTSPQMWGAVVSNLNYGDRVSADSGAEGKDGWLKVTDAKGSKGYVHVTAVTTKKVVLAASSNREAHADPSEVVLAGKGFSKEVENQFAKTHALNFAAVDAVERNKTSGAQLGAFIKEGKLGAPIQGSKK